MLRLKKVRGRLHPGELVGNAVPCESFLAEFSRHEGIRVAFNIRLFLRVSIPKNSARIVPGRAKASRLFSRRVRPHKFFFLCFFNLSTFYTTPLQPDIMRNAMATLFTVIPGFEPMDPFLMVGFHSDVFPARNSLDQTPGFPQHPQHGHRPRRLDGRQRPLR